MQELSDELGVSNHQLSRIINERFGKTFHELLNFYRTEEVKRLLTETGDSITDIFYQVGFNSKSAFNNQFSKLVGTFRRGSGKVSGPSSRLARIFNAGQGDVVPVVTVARGKCQRSVTHRYDNRRKTGPSLLERGQLKS